MYLQIARIATPAEDALVLALLEVRAIATFLPIVSHNLTVALVTAREIAQETETVIVMYATETEIEIATANASVNVRERKTATRIVTETAKRTAIATCATETENENANEKGNAIVTEIVTAAAEKTTDQGVIVMSPPPAPVPLAATARKPSASAIALAREAAMLGRTATSFESFGWRRGCLDVMTSMRCISSISITERGQRVYGVKDAFVVGVYGVAFDGFVALHDTPLIASIVEKKYSTISLFPTCSV